jgi:hypothetical protein
MLALRPAYAKLTPCLVSPNSNSPSPPPSTLPRLLLGAGLVFCNRVLLALGLRRRVDGWRRGAGLVLRGEAARFYLSAFHLKVLAENPPPELSRAEIEQRVLARLDAFMQTEKEFHLLVRHCRDYDEVVPHSVPTYAVGFEPAPVGPGQFIRPDSWAGPHGTPAVADASPVFEFICRVHPDQLVDVWLRINHVGADGVPAQELLSRLERAWGVGRPLVLPAKEDWAAFSGPRPSPGRGDAAEVQTFIDFSPLLAWRKRENQKLPAPMTVSAAILWQLARHPQFAPLFLGTTVEVPAVGGLGRGVAIVVVRPADYFSRPDGLAQFVAAFNLELARTKQRASAALKTLNAAAFLPPRLEESLLRHTLDEGGRGFGSLGLTILKDARIFGAPFADAGHANGFIALGSVTLPAVDGRQVGCLVIKGPRGRIGEYGRIPHEALGQPQTGKGS